MLATKLTKHSSKIFVFLLICIFIIIFRHVAISNNSVDDPASQLEQYQKTLPEPVEETELERPEDTVLEQAQDPLVVPVQDQVLGVEPKQDSFLQLESNIEPPSAVDSESVLTNETLNKLRSVLNCKDRDFMPNVQMRNNYWVMYNFVRAEHGAIGCHEAVTFAAHGDFTYMEHLLPVVERWKNPVSFSLHAPGDDLEPTVSSIRHARDCSGSDLIKLYVTFHVYFPIEHRPNQIPDVDKLIKIPYNCSGPKPYLVDQSQIYKSKNNVVFPINLARNVAREPALTHFHIVTDIELYPSPNIPISFLNMIARNEPPNNTKNPHVYVMNLFEIEQDQKVPNTKAELATMLKDGVAVPFHSKICASCHNVPGRDEWLKIRQTPKMNVFRVAKRTGRYKSWEPIFIGTYKDPMYDDRLPWEGKRDKMPHAYAMCVMNYDFMVLNNAFLVHAPGIKNTVRYGTRSKETNYIINAYIIPELKLLYGTRVLLAILLLFVIIILYCSFTGDDLPFGHDDDKLTDHTLRTLRSTIDCKDRSFNPRYQLRGNYWVLYDYVKAGHGNVGCHEAVTLAIHADYIYMDHLLPMVIRWKNPISLSLFAPGDDFQLVISSIRYVRDCSGSDLIKMYVTFHVFFPVDHRPKKMPNINYLINTPYDCNKPKPYIFGPIFSYRKTNNIFYPINVARNIARESSLTHFHFVDDIELYPTPYLPARFLNMIARNEPPLNHTNPRVYVLNLFEIEKDQQVPSSKLELRELLQRELAVPFHQKICSACHNVPGMDEWLKQDNTPRMKVFRIAKRKGKFHNWEPMFIGTDADPIYDDRIPWEMQRDKMPQAYIMCLLNYDFMILNNAFLVHSPGIKTTVRFTSARKEADKLFKTYIAPELKLLYGTRRGCLL